MNRQFVRCLFALSLALPGVSASAQTSASAAHVEATARKEAAPAAAPAPGPARAVAPVPRHALFGSLPIGLRSDEARKLLEKALDQYENELLETAAMNAHQAAIKDSRSAVAHALWSYVASRSIPAPDALQRAKALAPKAPADEQLLVNWLIDVQQADNIAAIGAMNDLLARFPNDKHVLFLTSEWLYGQQDYDRARKMQEKLASLYPDFAPAYNMLGYIYIQTGDPDPAKAISSLKRYAALQPTQPNPQDSLGEVLRFAGDDQGSLEHFSAALRIITNFIASQNGLGDTRTLMGDYTQARVEYDKAVGMATNSRDRFHSQFQKALVNFWEGKPEQGRQALDTLLEQARAQKDAYAQFEIGFANADLAADTSAKLEKLHTLEIVFEKPVTGMTEPDRHIFWATIVREEARLASLSGQIKVAQEAVGKLERVASETHDLVVANSYESARGYLLFAQGDFASAVDELGTDPHSPLALQQLAIAQERLGNAAAAESARARLKYQRAPTVEWFLVAHSNGNDTRSADNTAH
jgi:predicted Zn-dependent protease